MFYRSAAELMINFGSIPNTLVDLLNDNEFANVADMGYIMYGAYIILYAQFAFIVLGFIGLWVSYKRNQLKGIKWMKISAWALIGSYVAMFAVCWIYNALSAYHYVMGVPVQAFLGIGLGFVFVRQVFMFRWYTHPETVMVKEIATLSVFKNQSKKPCPSCQKEVTESLESCPHCGYALAERWKCRACKQVNTASREICYSCGHPPRK